MQFFDQLHDPERDQRLDERTSNPAFERFYRDHIRKLLLVRNRQRYLAKGNYNATRLRYIRKLFPDARFVVPVRHPVNQVASLVKQDRLFEQASADDPRVPRQLGMSGHFEFGPGRRPVCIGAGDDARSIVEHWQAGRAVAGWALYWNSLYEHVLETLEEDKALAESVLLLRYEDLCADPARSLRRLFEHVCLSQADAETLITEYAERISAPDYYRPAFDSGDRTSIDEATHYIAGRLGYATGESPAGASE
jgi:hypothetical protein